MFYLYLIDILASGLPWEKSLNRIMKSLFVSCCSNIYSTWAWGSTCVMPCSRSCWLANQCRAVKSKSLVKWDFGKKLEKLLLVESAAGVAWRDGLCETWICSVIRSVFNKMKVKSVLWYRVCVRLCCGRKVQTGSHQPQHGHSTKIHFLNFSSRTSEVLYTCQMQIISPRLSLSKRLAGISFLKTAYCC